MSTHISNNGEEFGKREIPKINGSSSAFIAVVIILILIIIVSCSAIAYIIREDTTDDEEALTRGDRGRYQSQRGKYRPPLRKWLFGAFRNPNPRITVSTAHSDKSRSGPGRNGKGWFRAGSGTDWDTDSVINDHPPSQISARSNMPMTERDSAFSSPRSSNVGSSYPHISSSVSDAGSSTRFDSHALRGLSFAEQAPLSAQGIIPSIHSQLYSTSSSPSSPSSSPSLTPHDLSSTGLSSRALSLAQLDNSISQSSVASVPDVINRSTFSSDSQPQLRRFEGGTKFIEGL